MIYHQLHSCFDFGNLVKKEGMWCPQFWDSHIYIYAEGLSLGSSTMGMSMTLGILYLPIQVVLMPQWIAIPWVHGKHWGVGRAGFCNAHRGVLGGEHSLVHLKFALLVHLIFSSLVHLRWPQGVHMLFSSFSSSEDILATLQKMWRYEDVKKTLVLRHIFQPKRKTEAKGFNVSLKTEPGRRVVFVSQAANVAVVAERLAAGVQSCEKSTQIPIVCDLTVCDLTVDWVLGAVATQKSDVSPILDMPVQFAFDNSILAELSMLFNNLEMSNCLQFLTRLHGAVRLTDDTVIYPAQIPLSQVPDDPNAGQPLNQVNFVGRSPVIIG